MGYKHTKINNKENNNIKSTSRWLIIKYLYDKYKKIKPYIPRSFFKLIAPLFLFVENLNNKNNSNIYSNSKTKRIKSSLPKSIPLISVVIPSRVEEKIETICYLENQTYKNMEIIIEYDYKQEGVSMTRNRGAKKASGKYLFFCDNDIELYPDAIENLYLTIEKTKAKWVFGKFKINGEYIYNKNKNLQVPQNQKSLAFIEWFRGISTMSLVDKSINPIFDVNMKRYNDWDLWLTLYEKGYKPAFCNKVLFNTKSRPKGISRRGEQDGQYWQKKLYKKHRVVN